MNDTLATTLEDRGMELVRVANAETALEWIKQSIPPGSSVMHGSSATLREIGFTDYLRSKDHPWTYLKDTIAAEDDSDARARLRREASLADYYLGSVHALSETGQALIASGTGSQLGAYAYTAPHVIWVVGKQKLVANLDAAWRRLTEVALPRHAAEFNTTAPDNLGKALLFEREISPSRTVTVLLVDSELGW
jgi:L-lactate utilization protein LutC